MPQLNGAENKPPNTSCLQTLPPNAASKRHTDYLVVQPSTCTPREHLLARTPRLERRRLRLEAHQRGAQRVAALLLARAQQRTARQADEEGEGNGTDAGVTPTQG